MITDGASLIYTTPHIPSPLPSLVHSCLGITSLLKRQPLKHNVIDRDKILVPPNWDSWGKIRVLRDGFDVEATSVGWSHDIRGGLDSPVMTSEGLTSAKSNGDYEGDALTSAVAPYEDWIKNMTTTADALALGSSGTTSVTQVEVESQDAQDFLTDSLAKLDAFKSKAEQKSDAQKPGARAARRTDESAGASTKRTSDDNVSEHIGPVQFNMGGIQVDADDMVQRLKDRQAFTDTPEQPASPAGKSAEPPEAMNTENLQAFFSGLMNRKGASNSPRATNS